MTDGNQAMLNAITAKFGASQRQRCVVYKLENVLGYVPTKQREQVEPEWKTVFYQNSRAVAVFIEKYQCIYPTAASEYLVILMLA